MQNLLDRPLGDDPPAVRARAGPTSMIQSAAQDGVFIMFDDDAGVADIREMAQRSDQAFIVALVEADGRFIEHIGHADKAGTDLRGKADALKFAAGEAAGLAIEGEISEAHIIHESEPRPHLLKDRRGDLRLLGIEFEAAEKIQGPRDGQARDLMNVLIGDGDREGLGLEAFPLAFFAGLLGEVFAEARFDEIRIGIFPAPLEHRQNALKIAAVLLFILGGCAMQ